jgi:hypothetical protein
MHSHMSLKCARVQIRFLLLQNRQGKTRLSKWYTTMSTDEKLKTQTEVHRLVTNRDPKFTNFIEVACSRYAADCACL